jgi:hypothetical protein
MKIIHLKIILTIAILAAVAVWTFQFLKLKFEPQRNDSAPITQKKPVKSEALNEPAAISAQESTNPHFDVRCEIADQLDTSLAVSEYLKNNFSITEDENETALTPEIFVKLKTGGPQDAAVFAAFALSCRNFEAEVIRYTGTRGGKAFAHSVAIFRDKDAPKYLTAGPDGIKIIAHGWSFEDLMKKEEERTGAKISEYAIFNPGITDLKTGEWIQRKQ